MTSENKIQLIEQLREYQAEVKNDYEKITDKGTREMTITEFAAAVLMEKHIKYCDEIIDILLRGV